jgi:hypothetical protein
LGDELGFTISKRTFVSSPGDPRLRYPGRQIHTGVEVSLSNKKLNVFHAYPTLHGSNARASMAQANKRESYSLGLDASGEIVAKQEDTRVAETEIAKRICMPLFEYIEPSR